MTKKIVKNTDLNKSLQFRMLRIIFKLKTVFGFEQPINRRRAVVKFNFANSEFTDKSI